MEIDIEQVWDEYQLYTLEEQLENLFPADKWSVKEMFSDIISGDILGGISNTIQMVIDGLVGEVASLRTVFIWILVLGIVAAVISHFIGIFDNHQVADIGFCFTYLCMMGVLIKCFMTTMTVASEAMANIVNFIRVFVPAYFLSVGVATGTLTSTVGYQLMILIIYMVEHVLTTLVLPLISSYVLLAVVNGLWTEEKLGLLAEGIEKAIRFLLKAAIGIVTGISAFQSMITPAIDSVKATALHKTIAAIPGIGDAADGVMDVVLGSAVLIKNGIGVVLLLLLIGVAAVPLCKIFIMSFLMKVAAAVLGVVSDKRIVSCTDKVGNGSRLLFKTAGTALLLFMITISIAAYTTNRGF